MKKNILSIINAKLSPFAQLLLLFNYSLPKNSIVMFMIIFPKYFAMTVLCSNFCFYLTSEYAANYSPSKFILQGTFSYYLPSFSYSIYYSLSAFILVLEICYFSFIMYYYYLIKQNNTNSIVLGKLPKYIFIFMSVMGQHVMEFYSFAFLILFRSKWNLPNESNVIYERFANVPLVKETPNNLAFAYLVCVMNIFSYIMANGVIYVSLLVFNSPFHSAKRTLKMRHKHFAIFFVIIANFYGVHYFVFFIGTKSSIIIFKSIMMVTILFTLNAENMSQLHKYETQNFIFILIEFLNCLSFISALLEITIGITNAKLTDRDVIMYIVCKLILAFFTLYLFLYYKKRYLLRICALALFERIDSNNANNIIEAYHYLLDLLIEFKTANKFDENIIELFVEHYANCIYDNCRCKRYNILRNNNIRENKMFIRNIYINIGLLIERAFASSSHLIHFAKSSFVIAEYHYNIRGNLLFAIALLQSHIANNMEKLSWFDYLLAYSLNNNYINVYMRRMKQSDINFNEIFDVLQDRNAFNILVISYCERIDAICNAKMNFESSLKFANDDNELFSVDSMYMNRKVVCELINLVVSLCEITYAIKKKLNMSSKIRHSLEFYYLIFLFYNLFENKYSQRIKSIFNKVDELKGGDMRSEEFGKKFDSFFERRINAELSYIIIDFWKGSHISYISSSLCNRLGFAMNDLKNEDISVLLPKQIRIKHKYAIIHFLIERENGNSYFNSNVHMINKNESLIPIELKSANVPHLTKNIVFICEVRMKAKNKKMRFMLDENFGDIAISKALETHFFFDLSMLKKCDFDCVEIFDTSTKKIKSFFANYISEYRKKITANIYFIEYYASIFANLSSFEYDMISQMNNNNAKSPSISGTVMSHSLICENELYFAKDRIIISNNLMEGFNRMNDSSSLKEDLSKKLSLLKNSLTMTNNSQIHFRMKIKPLYDTFLYIVDLIDAEKSNNKLSTLISQNNKNVNYKSKKKFVFLSQATGLKVKQSKIEKPPEHLHIPPEVKQGNSLKKMSKIIEKQSLTNVKYEVLISTLFISISLIFVFYIFYIGLSRVTIAETITKLLFQLCLQRDKLIYLHSSLLTHTYELGKYTSLNVTDEELFDQLHLTSLTVQGTLIPFYKTLNDYNFKNSLDNISALFNQTFTKIIGDWQEVEYQSDYLNEMNYVLYLVGAAIREGEVNEIKNDISMFFFDGYKSNTKQKIKSLFGTVLFFVNKNMNSSLKGSLLAIIAEVKDHLNEEVISGKYKNLIYVLVWFFSMIVCFISSFKIIGKVNKRFYVIIITMFLDKGKKIANIKNQQDNLAFKQKIGMFINLLKDFNDENRKISKNFAQNNQKNIIVLY